MDTFKHVVGRATLSQGLTVRRDFEAWFGAPPTRTNEAGAFAV